MSLRTRCFVQNLTPVRAQDPFDQDHWDAYTEMTEAMGKEVQIVGDDLLVTNPKRIAHAKESQGAGKHCISITCL